MQVIALMDEDMSRISIRSELYLSICCVLDEILNQLDKEIY